MNRKSFIATLFATLLMPVVKLLGKKTEIPHPEPGQEYYLVQWSYGEGLHKVYLRKDQIDVLNQMTLSRGVFAPKAKFCSLPKHVEDPYPLLKRINNGERFDKNFFYIPADKTHRPGPPWE